MPQPKDEPKPRGIGCIPLHYYRPVPDSRARIRRRRAIIAWSLAGAAWAGACWAAFLYSAGQKDAIQYIALGMMLAALLAAFAVTLGSRKLDPGDPGRPVVEGWEQNCEPVGQWQESVLVEGRLSVVVLWPDGIGWSAHVDMNATPRRRDHRFHWQLLEPAGIRICLGAPAADPWHEVWVTFTHAMAPNRPRVFMAWHGESADVLAQQMPWMFGGLFELVSPWVRNSPAVA